MAAPSPELEARVRKLLEQGDAERASVEVIRGYGATVLAYLRAVLRDDGLADDAFSLFCEHLWQGLGQYRGEASLRAFAFGVAWGAVRRCVQDGYRKRKRRLETHEISKIAEAVRSSTAGRTALHDGIERLRAQLGRDEQTLLFLRIDQELSWREVAEAMREGEPDVEEAALRKRFERVKARLRKLAEAEGLIGGS